ncbi:MAG: hypothetical protein ACUVX9_12155 [Anaerolineae bacterium]
MTQALAYNNAGLRRLPPTPEALCPVLQDPACTLWVDVDRSDDLTALAGLFDWHRLALEDVLGHVEHPKIDNYGRYLYWVPC